MPDHHPSPVFDLLLSDPEPAIRSEAAYLKESKILQEGTKLPKEEWKIQKVRIDALEPKVRFSGLHQRFINELKTPDYSVDELEKFARSLVAPA